MPSPGLQRLRDLQLFRPPNGMWANLGMRLVEMEEGNVVVEAHFSSELHGARGGIHRGAIAALADGALACAAATLVETGQVATTVELLVDFFAPAAPGVAIARGRVLHRQGHLVYCETVIEQGDDKLADGHATIALITPS